MDNAIIAYCGLNCSECDAYKATQAKDSVELERVATEWREGFNLDITAATVRCDGCLVADGGLLCSACDDCPIRVCAREREVASCAHCSDYGCNKLEEFLSHVTNLRQELDAMRADFLAGAAD